MHSFAHKQNQPRQKSSTHFIKSNKSAAVVSHEAHPLLHLQRTIGNQAVLRLLQARADGLESSNAKVEDETLARNQDSQPLQTKHVGSSDSGQIAAPPIVREVMVSPGRPLDAATRAFMEPRFDHDFSQVRIHADQRANQATGAVGALAYTLGDHIAFASGRYQPGSASGSRLLAHELAHVVQQQNTSNSPQAKLAIGKPADSAEQEADAAAHAALATAHMPVADAVRFMPRLSSASVSHPVLRRTPQETWGGKFEADIYDLVKPVRGKNEANYGVNIRVIFTPNERVNAEKIALVQTAQTLVDGMPYSVHSKSKNDVTRGRSIPDYEVGQGTHIDQTPSIQTPLVGMTDPSTGSDLAGSVPGKNVQLGYHYNDKAGLHQDNAWMWDPPRLKVADKSQGSQTFETTALAIAGAQKGAYYGSVQWGWNKDASALSATKITFQRVSKDAPSSEFSQAAGLWNTSVTSQGKATIDLPTIAFMYTNIKKVTLMDNPAKPKSLGNLDLNTRLQVTDQADPTKTDWQNVIVIDGPLAGKMGWVKKGMLSDRQTQPARKK